MSFFLNIFSCSNLSEIPDNLRIQIEKEINCNPLIDNNYFNSYLVKYPYSDFLVGMKTIFFLQDEKIEEAEEFLQQYTKNSKFSKGTFVNLAEFQINNIKNPHSENTFQLLLKSKKYDKQKNNKYVYLFLFDYYLKKDIKKAKKYLDFSLKIDSTSTIGLLTKSYYYREIGNDLESIKILESLIEKKCTPFAFFYRSVFFYEEGDLKAAESILLQGMQIKEIPEFFLLLGRIYGDKNNKEAELNYYENGLQKFPDNKDLLNNLGWFYLHNRDFTKAIDIFNKLIDIHPKNQIEDYYSLINVLLLNNNLEIAENYLNELIQIYPQKNYTYFYYSILLHGLKKDSTLLNEKVNDALIFLNDEEFDYLVLELKKSNINIIEH